MQYNIIANRRNVETSYSALYKLPGQHDALKKNKTLVMASLLQWTVKAV